MVQFGQRDLNGGSGFSSSLQISPGYKIDGKDILSIGFVDAYSVPLAAEVRRHES
jgi:hypothetical protein